MGKLRAGAEPAMFRVEILRKLPQGRLRCASQISDRRLAPAQLVQLLGHQPRDPFELGAVIVVPTLRQGLEDLHEMRLLEISSRVKRASVR